MAFLKNLKLRGVLVPLLLGLLAVGYMGCGGRKGSSEEEEPERRVKGNVTYQRIPIKVDDKGYPTGLGSPSNAETLPLRGAFVRAIYSTEETMPDESKETVWRQADSGYTDSEGNYSLLLPTDVELPAFVEIQSISGYSGNYLRIIAEPDGIHCHRRDPQTGEDVPVPQADRVIYSMRKGIDGLPSNDKMPAATKEGEIQLDFEIGLEDKWWISHPSRGNSLKHAESAELEPIGTGSKVAAIIDTAYKAMTFFGSATPDAALDLHYRQGRTEPFGTYVEFDREKFPSAFEPGTSIGGGTMHYFGSVRGGPNPETDDAWDEGTLLTMMARNYYRSFGVLSRFHLPPKKGASIDDPINQLTTVNLHPSMAVAEGMPDAMTAVTLGTPYLTSGSGTAVRDIRDLTELPKDIYSGPAIAALTWEIALKANEIESPEDPSAWADINRASIVRLYSLLSLNKIDQDTGAVTEIVDLPSLFTMLSKLAYTAALDEPVDLAEIFSDEVLSELTESFFGYKIWPHWPQDGESEDDFEYFIKDWGTDPGRPPSENNKNPGKQIQNFVLSMADSVLDADGKYSNITKNEHLTAKIKLSKDTPYLLSVSTEPSLPDGASIEFKINGNALSPHIFNSASPGPKRIVLPGSGSEEYPSSYLLDFSIKSPTVKVGGDITVKVRFDLSSY
jgi:hypothetical protein